ncbi:unnamed protein product [Vitrella brassicaformis CCMP3155]|uniref:Kinetochore protein NDC80 n=2 Tax=Vitrella brassicaformis TaxID=1169539 RepID=A0A0G4ENJ7_VITBC|nr:unnamed protein product [Vitrella brassicaformis CCMP3155]|eukprot:CEL99433.1 unnamed protein product [Vitrella brassicaformis CCMP3155]
MDSHTPRRGLSIPPNSRSAASMRAPSRTPVPSSAYRPLVGKPSLTGKASLGGKAGALVKGGKRAGAGLRVSQSLGKGSKRADPRNFHDRGFQKECGMQLLQYLNAHDYPYPMTAKQLNSPSRNDFFNVVKFLIGVYDNEYRYDKSIEVDISSFFRYVRYPNPISKTALLNVGAPNTWPSLLAALQWLIELCQYAEQLDDREDPFGVSDVEEEGAHGSSEASPLSPSSSLTSSLRREQWVCLKETYALYMAGEDHYPEQDRRLKAHYEQMESALQTRLQNARDRSAEQAASKLGYQEDLQKEDTLKASIARKQTDMEKLSREIRRLQENRQKKEGPWGEVARAQREVEAVRQIVQELSAEEKRLKETVAAQEISASDVEHLLSEQRRYETKYKADRDDKAKLDHSVMQMEDKLHQRQSSLSSNSRKLQSLMSAIRHDGQLPSTDSPTIGSFLALPTPCLMLQCDALQPAALEQHEKDKREWTDVVDSVLGVDSQRFRDQLEGLIEQEAQHHSKLSAEADELQRAIDAMTKTIKQNQQAKDRSHCRYERHVDELQRLQKQHEEEVNNINKETQATIAKVEKEQADEERSLRQIEEEKELLRDQITAQREEWQQRAKTACDIIKESVRMVDAAQPPVVKALNDGFQALVDVKKHLSQQEAAMPLRMPTFPTDEEPQ